MDPTTLSLGIAITGLVLAIAILKHVNITLEGNYDGPKGRKAWLKFRTRE